MRYLYKQQGKGVIYALFHDDEPDPSGWVDDPHPLLEKVKAPDGFLIPLGDRPPPQPAEPAPDEDAGTSDENE